MQAHMAFDKTPSRFYDRDGRLHHELSHISKSNVCSYKGYEIPNWEALDLSANKIYKLFRDPKELERGASTFNRIPVLHKHVPINVANHDPGLIVGATGSDAVYNHPYLDNSIVVWEQSSIEGVDDDSKRELSSAYYYDADMTPGNYEGEQYDGIMRNICGNHVALVTTGRAGNDVVVGDSIENLEIDIMTTKILSRQGAFAKGSLAIYLKPKMAMDTKLDLNSLVAPITNRGWKTDKVALKAAIRKALAGKMAKDADLNDLDETVDNMDPTSDVPDEAAAPLTAPVAPTDPDAPDPDAVMGPHDQVMKFLEGKLSPEDCAEISAMLKPADTVVGDAITTPPVTTIPPSKKPPAMDNPMSMTKPAMDAALAQVRKDVKAEARALRVAEAAVRPLIGEIAMDSVDSAEEVYRMALESKGIDLTGVDPSAFSAMVPLAIAAHSAPLRRTVVAMDAKSASGFETRYPEASRLKNVS